MSLIQEALRRQHGDSDENGETPNESSSDAHAPSSPLKLKASKTPNDASGEAPPPSPGMDAPAPPPASGPPSLPEKEPEPPAALETPVAEEPPVPDITHTPPAEEQKPQRATRVWPLLLGASLGGILVAGGIIWVGVYAFQNFFGEDEPEPAEPPTSEVDTTPEPSAPSVSPPSPAPPESPTVAPAPTTPEVTEPVPTPKPPVEKPVEPPPSPALVTPTPPKPAPRPQPRPPRPKKAVLWPILEVNGIFAKEEEGKGAAVINNEIVDVGRTIEGVKVIKVTKDAVTLEYEGDTKTLRVRDFTN